MKIFVINLARNPERMSRMEAILGDCGLNFERLDAVDGRQMVEDVIEHWSARQPDGSFYLSPSEVGCMMSHRVAWEKIAEMPDGHAVILEDDIHLSKAAADFLSRSDWIPSDAEIVKIETVKWKTAISKQVIHLAPGHSLARLFGQHFGMAGYILTPSAARRLLEEIGQVRMAIDQIIFDPASTLFHGLSIYQMMPALCIQDQFLGEEKTGLGSDITRAWQVNRKPKSIGGKIAREFRRLRNQIAAAVSGSPLNPLSGHINIRVDFPTETAVAARKQERNSGFSA